MRNSVGLCSRVCATVAIAVGLVVAVAGPADASLTFTPLAAPVTGLNPAANSPEFNELSAVSCFDANDCVAVGDYGAADATSQASIETLSGGTWTAITAPLTGLSPAAPANPGAELDAVSCPAAGTCIAVGTYSRSGMFSEPVPLVETLSGGTWSASNMSLSGLDPAASNVILDILGISCTSATSCVVVGGYESAAGGTFALVATLSGSTWTATTLSTSGLTPAPASPSLVALHAVSCSAQGACVAVGSYRDSSNNNQGLIATLSAGTWTPIVAPLSALSPASHTPASIVLVGISCPATGACVAVGTYADNASNDQGLIESLSAGTWAASTAPLTGVSPVSPASSPSVSLRAVSCPVVATCLAIGIYKDKMSNRQGFFETLSGGTWGPSTAPLTGLNPASSTTPVVDSTGVSCSPAGNCVGVGRYMPDTTHEVGLIESTAFPTALVFTDDSPATTGTVNVHFPSYKFVATGPPTISYNVVAGTLPPGLHLNATTGVLSGTPTAGGTYTLAVQASNGTNLPADSPSLTITINPAALTLTAPVSIWLSSAGEWTLVTQAITGSLGAPGVPVTFYSPTPLVVALPLCSATSGPDGSVTCQVAASPSGSGVPGATFYANFAGSPTYTAATSSDGTLVNP